MEQQLERLTDLLTDQMQRAQQRDEAHQQEMRTLLSGLTGATNLGGTQGSELVQKTKLHNSVVTPPCLTWSASLREFDAWQHNFEGYARLVNITALKPSEQQTALCSLVDEEWTRMLRFGLDVKEDAALKTAPDAMEKHLRSQCNVVLDRREIYLRKQESGDKFDEFLCAIKEIAAFCDFCDQCMDNRIRDRIVV